MEAGSSLPHSQDPATCPYPEPAQPSPCSSSHFLKIHFNIADNTNLSFLNLIQLKDTGTCRCHPRSNLRQLVVGYVNYFLDDVCTFLYPSVELNLKRLRFMLSAFNATNCKLKINPACVVILFENINPFYYTV
jgi:hypothetical protein